MPHVKAGFLGNPRPWNSAQQLLGPAVDGAGRAFVDLPLSPMYLEHEIHIIGAQPVTAAVTAQLLVSFDGGSTFDTGASDYDNVQHLVDTNAGHTVGSGASTRCALSINADCASTGTFNSVVRIFNARSADYVKNFMFDSTYQRTTTGYIARVVGSSRRAGVSKAITHVRFNFGTGNITSGYFAVMASLPAPQ